MTTAEQIIQYYEMARNIDLAHEDAVEISMFVQNNLYAIQDKPDMLYVPVYLACRKRGSVSSSKKLAGRYVDATQKLAKAL
jgi:hypothetical protein